MADVRVASAGDSIPLLDDAGGGVYSVGRNNAHDVRFALLSSMIASAGGSFTIRAGVLPRGFSSGVWNSLQVLQNGTPNRFVAVNPGITVHTRTNEAAYLAYEPSTITIEAPAANATNPRIDLVVKRVYDKAYFPSDPFHGPYIEVIEGTAAASPVAPAVPNGAVLLAELARDAGSAGDTITTAKITDKRQATNLTGGTRLLLPGDLPAASGSVPGETRARLSSPTVLLPPEIWGADSQWHGLTTKPLARPTAVNNTHLGGLTAHTMATVSIADPGWPYRIEASAHALINLDPIASTTVSGIYGQINVDDQTFNPSPSSRRLVRMWGGLNPAPHELGATVTSPLTYTGAHNVYFIIYNDTSPSNFLRIEDNEFFTFDVKLIPV